MGLVGGSYPVRQPTGVVLAIAVQLRNTPGAAAFVTAVFPVWSFRRDGAFARRVGALRGAVHWGALPRDTLRLGMEGGKSVIGLGYNSCSTLGPAIDIIKLLP